MPKTELKELLDSTDIQAPTDFPPQPTAPGLRALDSALRCKICQELYDAPVVLTCGHCFCSLVRVTIIAPNALSLSLASSYSVHAPNLTRSQYVPPVGTKPPSVASG
jgi:RING-type zinc-finger